MSVLAPESRRTQPPAGLPPQATRRPVWRRLIDLFSSLRLTVLLLALSIVVVFFGTLAQTEDGLYVAQDKYFRSVFSVWSPHDPAWKWVMVPLPGGYLLGVLLLINLLAAHATRFKFTWKKAGIFLTHLGVIMLLVGQLATDMFARESRMRFAEGESRSFTEDFHKVELAVLTDAAQPGAENVVAFPESRLRAGATLQASELPFTLRVQEFMPNSDPEIRRPSSADPTSGSTNVAGRNSGGSASETSWDGIARRFEFTPQPLTREMDSKNIPTALVEAVGSDGQVLGRWALTAWAGDADMANVLFVTWMRSFQKQGDPAPFVRARRLVDEMTAPQTLEVAGKTYTLVLRPERYYQPFALDLQRVTHETYQGTDTPKNFQSRVRIDNFRTGEKREVDIYMNNPLRYDGLTFFQHQMDASTMNLDGRPVTVFQVVKNPSWLAPYAGTLVVGLGLIVQFSIHLVGFTRKRKAP
ncbi:MAG TPA: cytochrome c biogenesis protein ResB [Verrucomicrobiota bacterium]|nr:ResB protein required for cytochrome C biosynthesis [Verrucomicrobiales bacterium]HRI14523.1 cytochrome c biogenesis protein ResB [Verrucomicrobiota bacterium]